MSLFKKKQIDGKALLDKYDNGLLDDYKFLKLFGRVTVYHSTPFGDHKNGGVKLFALPTQEEDTFYLPVFTTTERASEFFEKAGRKGYLLMEGSFTSCLATIKAVNDCDDKPKFGAVLEPGYYGLTFEANALDTVIRLTL